MNRNNNRNKPRGNSQDRRPSSSRERNSESKRGDRKFDRNKTRGNSDRRTSFSKDRNEGGSDSPRAERKFDRSKPRGNSDRRASFSRDRREDGNDSPREERKFDRNKSRGNPDRRTSFSRDRREDGNDSPRGERKFDRNKSRGNSDRRTSFSRDRREGGNDSPRGERKFDRNKPFRRTFSRKPKPQVEEQKPKDTKVRLNKFIAKSGICSRREADEYIKEGLVEVNGKMIIEMGYKVDMDDEVRFDGKILTPEKKVYVLLNKPKGFITTTNDERDRKTVMDLVQNATDTRLFPVGRLDRQTTGVLLFTNDGDLTKKLTHPSHNVKKIYHVVLDRNLHGDDMGKIREGISMQEGIAKVDSISYIEGKPHTEVGVEIHIGWNRVVRRIFEKLGYKIVNLDRVSFAGLTKKNVKRGSWRILDRKEVDFLKMM